MNDETRPPETGDERRAKAARRDYVPGAMGDESFASESEDVSKVLLDSFEPVEPDPSVWDRIAADISETGMASPSETGGTVVSLDSRRRMWPALFSVAAVILAVLGTVVVINATSDGGIDFAADVVYELADPDSGSVTMTIEAADDGTAIATAAGLEALGPDETYQLWSVVGEEIVSVGLLGSDPDEVPLRIEGDPAVLALTIEVAGGVAVSEATPVAVWQATS